MTVYLAAPSAPTATPSTPAGWSGLRMTWTGWDGSTWDLLSPLSGVRLTDGGVRGLAMPPVERFTSSGPSVAGSRWRGWRAGEREVFWPLLVYTDTGSQEWMDYDRAFWRTMRPDAPGVWSVTQPDGTTRSLSCRFAGDGDPSFTVLPAYDGWAVYGVTLVAEQPYWSGPSVTRGPWETSTTPGDFPNYIASGSTLANATIDNPGDVASYPVVLIEGPSTYAEVGVGSQVVEVPFELLAGESVTIDMAPTAQTAVDNTGADRTGELGAAGFTSIPPGDSVALSLALTGTGRISMTLPTYYYRAW